MGSRDEARGAAAAETLAAEGLAEAPEDQRSLGQTSPGINRAEGAPPGRAQELAGHAVERVDT
jgi:hypothetical protein